MSDDDKKDGVTLPDGINSTHNVGLSPLFMLRGAVILIGDTALINRALEGDLWSSISKNTRQAYRFIYFSGTLKPNDSYFRELSLSLRCLVSTNNG